MQKIDCSLMWKKPVDSWVDVIVRSSNNIFQKTELLKYLHSSRGKTLAILIFVSNVSLPDGLTSNVLIFCLRGCTWRVWIAS